MSTVVVLLVLAGAALYFSNPGERNRWFGSALDILRVVLRAVVQPSPPGDPFDEFLRARTRLAIATPLLIAVSVSAYVTMIATGSGTGNQLLIDWGANYAPRTTNGEWWRLAASTFVHAGPAHLLATVAGLAAAGLILERAVGRLAVIVVFLSAGVVASTVALWTTSAVLVSCGGAGAVFGIYGLLLATIGWSLFPRPAGPIPLMAVKRVAVGAALFLAYTSFGDHMNTRAEVAGLATGFVLGLVITRGVVRARPPLVRSAAAMAAVAAIAAVCVLPLRGLTDFRPEVVRATEVEARTATVYDEAVDRFKGGRLPAKALAQVIDRSILPELQAVRTRVAAARGVPPEQAALVTAVEQYVQLREQSWRRRAEGLRKSSMEMLRDAERTERAALDALQRARPAA